MDLSALQQAAQGVNGTLDAVGQQNVSDIKTTEGNDPPNEITGRTVHGDQQVLSRDGHGVSDEAMNDAVQNPIKPPDPQPGRRYKYLGKNATVVLNSAGKVVTAWARNSGGWRNP